jgi:hypothetical protein
LTVAHVAIAEAALVASHLDGVDLVLSTVALGKEDGHHGSIDERLAAVEEVGDPRFRAVVTDANLIADIARGYGAVVVGADKWHQLHDVGFYGSDAAMELALARLPRLLVAPRAGIHLPDDVVEVLDLAPAFREVSSTAVRAGRTDWRADFTR